MHKGGEKNMLDDENTNGWLTSWLNRLDCQLADLEKDAAIGKTENLAKDLTTCDTSLKKLYIRAKEHIFPTAAGPQAVHDLAKVKVRLERLKKKIAQSTSLYSSSLHDGYLRENLA
jgi:hypothetical protein